MKTNILKGLLLLAFLFLPGSLFAGDGHAVTHAWSMEHGNLIPNWSFENELEVWSDSASGGMTDSSRFDSTGFPGYSGRFMGRVYGTTSTSGEILLLRANWIPVQPRQPYTLSFYVRSKSTVGSSCFPAVRFHKDLASSARTVNGTAYSTFSGSSTISGWTLYTLQFTPDSDEVLVDIALWRSATSSVAANLFFDDAVLEEGSLDTNQVKARRARYGYSASFSDGTGKTWQSQTRLPEDAAKYRVEGVVYDSAGRPVKTPMPVVQGLSSGPAFNAHLLDTANAYYNGTKAPDAGGYAYSEVQYDSAPDSRVLKSAAPGNTWRLSGTHTVEAGFYFVANLAVPGNIKSPSTDNTEQDYRLDWAKDEDSVFTLTWTNRKGQVIQTARRDSPSSWAYTRMDYYPSGQVRKVRTPLDTTGATFAEIRNYDATGQLTSSYTQDRGLEKFWYNKRGMLRYSQDEKQRPSHKYSYFDYDSLGNLVSTGEQTLSSLSQSTHVDGDSYGTIDDSVKIESKGYIYGSLASFQSRTGVSLDSVAYPITLILTPRANTLMAAYHRNSETPAPGFTPLQKLVVDLYEYDSLGRVTRQHKYLGAMQRDKRIHTVAYSYDDLDRLTLRRTYEGADTVPQMTQGYAYDALGRVTSITGLAGDTIARYTYDPRGPLDSVWLGQSSHGGGMGIAYGYHVRGWMGGMKATQISTGNEIYRQDLGYEDSVHASGIPSLTKASYTGQITQQLYKYTADVPNPVRAVNYAYDPMGRMTTADYRQGTGLNSNETLQFPLSLSNVDDLDTRVAYDVNGRILGKRSGGVSSGDSAAYSYQTGSYRLDHVTGKLSSTGGRNASDSHTFVYDADGNMLQDSSKQMSIDYTYDGMPTQFRVQGTQLVNGTLEPVLYQFYDASGYRVSQVAAPKLAEQFPVYVVGHAEGEEGAGLYNASSVKAALRNAQYRATHTHFAAPDSVLLYVVADNGVKAVTPDTSGVGAVDGIKVVLHGVQKYSADYDALVAKRTGTKVFAQHYVNMGGMVVSEVREGYDGSGAVAYTRNTENVFGRGSPIGRYVATDSGMAYQFYVRDHLGSTVRVVSADGGYGTTPTYDYQAYGETQGIREDSLNTVIMKFTGKQLEDAMDLYYFGARWYDPAVGLWASPDPANQYWNDYSYTNGNVLNSLDQDGESAYIISRPILIGGAQAGTAVHLLTVVVNEITGEYTVLALDARNNSFGGGTTTVTENDTKAAEELTNVFNSLSSDERLTADLCGDYQGTTCWEYGPKTTEDPDWNKKAIDHWNALYNKHYKNKYPVGTNGPNSNSITDQNATDLGYIPPKFPGALNQKSRPGDFYRFVPTVPVCSINGSGVGCRSVTLFDIYIHKNPEKWFPVQGAQFAAHAGENFVERDFRAVGHSAGSVVRSAVRGAEKIGRLF